jgi:hypothetical protein
MQKAAAVRCLSRFARRFLFLEPFQRRQCAYVQSFSLWHRKREPTLPTSRSIGSSTQVQRLLNNVKVNEIRQQQQQRSPGTTAATHNGRRDCQDAVQVDTGNHHARHAARGRLRARTHESGLGIVSCKHFRHPR